jgi:hypothetical protein
MWLAVKLLSSPLRKVMRMLLSGARRRNKEGQSQRLQEGKKSIGANKVES